MRAEYPMGCWCAFADSYALMGEIWWSFHHVESLGASSEMIHNTFGKSFRVSITFST